MKKVAFYTLGCKVNTYETEGMKYLFEKAGYKVSDFDDKADIYVINTCTVTHLSDRKSRQIIRRAKKNNPNALIAAVGCYAQIAPEDVADIEGVNLVLGNRFKNKILQYIESLDPNDKLVIVKDKNKEEEYEELWIDKYTGQTRAFLKIQDGCDQFCSYCIIPYARGRMRSRNFSNLIKEAKRLADNGFKEIVLTGIHLTSYGRDKSGEKTLLDVIDAMHQIEGIKRIRLGSLEPVYISDLFIKKIKEMPRLCPHFHLSLQSGCNKTLKRMNRRYTTEEFEMIVKKLRESLPDVAISTDIMVGFPGETEEEFDKTLSFVRKMEFAIAHIFKYSPRKGTAAAKFPGQVSAPVKEARSKRLFNVVKESQIKFRSKYIGKDLEVLFERHICKPKEVIEGFTRNYIPVKAIGGKKFSGKIKKVKIEKIEDGTLLGTILNSK